MYKKNPKFVIPDSRFNEIKKFVERGLQDFSISRLKSKMPWGVPVPNDDEHVMYVWFDALVNYVSTLGWPNNKENFENFWVSGTPVQYCGKDNLRQQSAMWQAMLMSAKLPATNNIVIGGFINFDGQKMSKSLGNVINPYDVVKEYGTDALRYYLARELSTFEDSNMTMEKFKKTYNGNLANGLGNLVSRIMKMAEGNQVASSQQSVAGEIKFPEEYREAVENFNLQEAMNIIWKRIGEIDKKIQETEPFKLLKGNDKEKKLALELIQELTLELNIIAQMLTPFMPETSEKIKTLIKENKSPEKPLFARKD